MNASHGPPKGPRLAPIEQRGGRHERGNRDTRTPGTAGPNGRPGALATHTRGRTPTASPARSWIGRCPATRSSPPRLGPTAPMGGWGPPPAAPKPGVIPLRPLGIPELLDGAITAVRRYPKAILVPSFVVALGLGVVSYLTALVEHHHVPRDQRPRPELSDAAASLPASSGPRRCVACQRDPGPVGRDRSC